MYAFVPNPTPYYCPHYCSSDIPQGHLRCHLVGDCWDGTSWHESWRSPSHRAHWQPSGFSSPPFFAFTFQRPVFLICLLICACFFLKAMRSIYNFIFLHHLLWLSDENPFKGARVILWNLSHQTQNKFNCHRGHLLYLLYVHCGLYFSLIWNKSVPLMPWSLCSLKLILLFLLFLCFPDKFWLFFFFNIYFWLFSTILF